MQTSTAHGFPDWLGRNPIAVFWLLGFFAAACFSFAAYTETRILYLLPLAIPLVLAMIFNIRTLYYVLLLVLPFSVEMTFGNFGTDLPSEPIVITLAGFTVVYFILRRPYLDQSKHYKPILALVALHLAWVFIAMVFSMNFFTSLKFFVAKCWYLLTFFMLTSLLVNSRAKFLAWFWCLCIPTVFSVLIILGKHASFGFTFDTINKAVDPIYRNHVNYGVFISMFLPFLFLARSWYAKGSLLRLFLQVSIVCVLAAIYFTYTRGAWLAVIAMPVYYLVIRFRLTKVVLAAAVLSVFLFAAYILHDRTYLKHAPNYETTIYHEELGEHLTSTLEMEDMSTVERFYRWLAAVKMYRAHALYGVGPGNFVSYYKPYTVSAYETYISENEERSTVHNYFLLLLTEQGIPALILFCILIAVVLISAEKMYHQAPTNYEQHIILAIALSLSAFIINNSLSDLVEANKVGSLFWMNLALLYNRFWKTVSGKPLKKIWLSAR